MSFEPADRANMMAGFPSKLADYSCLGIPLLIYGPSYCTAVRWARDNPGVAAVVDSLEPAALAAALMQLQRYPEQRLALGRQALKIGDRDFAYATVRDRFITAVNQPQR
jgi:hypothetical protein